MSCIRTPPEFPSKLEYLFQFLTVCENPRAYNQYKVWRRNPCIDPSLEPWALVTSCRAISEDCFDMIFYVTDGRRMYRVRDTQYYPWNKSLDKRTGAFHFVYVETVFEKMRPGVRELVFAAAAEGLSEI